MVSGKRQISGQIGGQDDIVVPTIVKTKTSPGTPFITNVAKEVFTKEKGKKQESKEELEVKEKPFRKGTVPNKGTVPTQQFGPNEPKTYPTLKLEMFAPPQQPQKPYGIYSPYIPLIEIPEVPKKFSPSSFAYLSAPTAAFSYGPNLKMPMQNVYNINLPGPTGGHVEMSKIYENILPGKDNKLTSTTMGERLQTYDYIRQMIIRINEGEDISIDTDGQNNLMSYIKFMELNPTFYSPLYNNPYRGLPFGLLVYRSCFPVRLEPRSQSIVCGKDSIGLNIRLYSLSFAEYYSYKFRQVIYKEYDVWRELAYYEYMREAILKPKISPNFPLLYAFFLCPNGKINYFSLKKNCLTQKDMLTKEYERFVEVHTLFSSVKPSDEIIRPATLPEMAKRVIAKLPDEIDPGLQAYSGTTLILITEAPHHNLYQWASRIYEKEGIVNKMISHGYHDENVWISILFQIIYALYVMQVHGIYMRNMTIEDNVYVKDLHVYGKAQGYWKYIVDGITYYIPNYGYIVFIDSNFKDIIPPGRTIERCKREYKIYTANIIGKRYSMESIRKKVFENYRKIISTNSFTKEHTQNNVTRPPEDVMKLIESMMVDPEMNLGKVLYKYFRPLMNNRIGTLLRKDIEVPSIREITGQFKPGEMAVEVIEEEVYKWCLVSVIKDDGIVEIITRTDPYSNDFLTKDIRMESLKQYSRSDKIDQNSTNEVNLSEESLLETYMIKGF